MPLFDYADSEKLDAVFDKALVLLGVLASIRVLSYPVCHNYDMGS